MARLGRLIADHRVAMLVAALLGLLWVGGQAARVVPDMSFRNLFPISGPEVAFTDALHEQLGNVGGQNLIGVLETQRGLEPEVVEALERIVREAGALPEFETVLCISNAIDIRSEGGELVVEAFFEGVESGSPEWLDRARRASSHAIYRKRLVSDDGRYVAILARFLDDVSSADARAPAVAAFERIVEANLPPDARVYFGGVPYVEHEFTALLLKDTLRGSLLLMLLLALALWLIFGSWMVAGLGIFCGACSSLCAIGWMGWLGRDMTILNSTITPNIFAIVVAESVYTFAYFYDSQIRGASTREAVIGTVSRAGRAQVIAFLTTSVGFFSFFQASVADVREWGRIMALGMLSGMVITVVVLPALLSLRPISAGALERYERRDFATPLLMRAGAINRHRTLLVLTSFLLAFLVAGAGLPKLSLNQFVTREVAADHKVRVATDIIEKHLAGIGLGVATLTVDGDVLESKHIRSLRRLKSLLEDQPEVIQVWSVVDYLDEVDAALRRDPAQPQDLPELHRELAAQYLLLLSFSEAARDEIEPTLSHDRSIACVYFTVGDIGARDFQDLVGRIVSFQDQLPHPGSVRVAGDFHLLTLGHQQIPTDIVRSFMIAFAVTFFVMLLVYRSLRIAALGLLPNLFPTLVIFGAFAWLGFPIRIGSAMMLAIAFTIADSDTVHFFLHHRDERRRGSSADEAMQNALHVVGRPMFISTICLVIGFLSIAPAEFLSIREMGVVGGAAFLLALLGDLFLGPALLYRFGSPGRGEPTTQQSERPAVS